MAFTLDLSVLYSGVASSGSSGGNPILALRQAGQDQAKKIAAEARKPEVQRDLAVFRKAVENSKDVKSLLANPTVLKVLLTTNGLADQVGYPALAVKALTSKVTDPKSLANKLPDTRWATAAATYDFATKGLATLKGAKVLDTIASAYAEISWRKSLDATTPGLSDALTFRVSAAKIRTADNILGDPIMRRVVTKTLGIPQEIAYQTLNAQEKAISGKIDLKKFQDKTFVDTFIRRYLVIAGNDAAQSSPSSAQLAAQSFGLLV